MPKSKKFKALLKSTKEYYVGRKVPPKYQKQYGKIYDEEEAKQVAYAIGKKHGWRV